MFCATRALASLKRSCGYLALANEITDMVVNFLGSREHAASDGRWQGGNRVVANEWAKFGILQVEGSSAGLIEFIGSGFVLIYYFIVNGLQLIQRSSHSTG